MSDKKTPADIMKEIHFKHRPKPGDLAKTPHWGNKKKK